MPVARYFIFVGSTLAVLLFILGECLPTPSVMFADQTAIDKAVIRIKSERKWPERIVLDTSQPTPTRLTVEETVATQSIQPPSDVAINQSNVEALAEIKPDTQPASIDRRTLQVKRRAPVVTRSRRVARASVTNRRKPMGEPCCRFGRIDVAQTISIGMQRRGAAFSWPLN